MSDYHKADFLWPHVEGSVEEAGFEFANANTEEYREAWWNILKSRLTPNAAVKPRRSED